MTTYAQKLTKVNLYTPTAESIYYVSYSQFKIAWRYADEKQKQILRERYAAWTGALESRQAKT
jgi:hypothetical protein